MKVADLPKQEIGRYQIREAPAAYWFTSSTSFANSAITVARSLTNTFAGIAPHDVPLFVVAQLLGAASAALVARWLFDSANDGDPNPRPKGV